MDRPESIPPPLLDAVDDRIGFTDCAAFIAGAIQRFVGNLAPDLAQPSLRAFVVTQ